MGGPSPPAVAYVFADGRGTDKIAGQLQQITVKHVTVNADQALVADNITTGPPSQSSPARAAGNMLTTGGQKAMEILDGDLVGVGGKKEI
jgi:hypothetical protein